ncbi:sensor histidine kinase [Nocardia sp. NPDC052278]|uniref:sensor histidine kinase n=1 Tax=unclassified Nocardia TaxID=2637762 RepID=UPI00368F4B47
MVDFPGATRDMDAPGELFSVLPMPGKTRAAMDSPGPAPGIDVPLSGTPADVPGDFPFAMRPASAVVDRRHASGLFGIWRWPRWGAPWLRGPLGSTFRRAEPGVARGVEWLLDGRSLPIRLSVWLALAVGCLLWLGDSPTVVDWVLGMGAVLVTVGGARLPLATSLAATGLLALGFEFGHTGPIVGKVAAAVALTELAVHRGGWRPWFGAAVLSAAYLLHTVGGTGATGYRAVVMAGLPLLIGGLLRAALDSAARARQATREVAQHRETAVAAARAAERTAIARELHDLIAHHVSSTVLRVGVARHALSDTSPAVRKVLDDIHASGKETLADLRKLVAILRDSNAAGESFVAPGDLPDAIEAAVRRTRQLGPAVETEIGDVTAVDAISALTLLRLTQEGLANVVKHGGSDAVARLVIGVADGVDFLLSNTEPNCEKVPAATGLGLVGLAERVELLGGRLTAGSTATGWRLAAHLPGRTIGTAP